MNLEIAVEEYDDKHCKLMLELPNKVRVRLPIHKDVYDWIVNEYLKSIKPEQQEKKVKTRNVFSLKEQIYADFRGALEEIASLPDDESDDTFHWIGLVFHDVLRDLYNSLTSYYPQYDNPLSPNPEQ